MPTSAPKSTLTLGHRSGKLRVMATNLPGCRICKIGMLYRTVSGLCHRCEQTIADARATREQVQRG